MNNCPFCRTTYPDKDGELLAMIQARVEKKDPDAICFLGGKYFFGGLGLQKNMPKAVELFEEAAELGSIKALAHLGNLYSHGKGVQEDKAKAIEFYKKAAMQGHISSRHNLGCAEGEKGNYDRSVRHWLISAKVGHKNSLEAKTYFMAGGATKDQYAQALTGYQDAVEKMKSHDRDEAKRFAF